MMHLFTFHFNHSLCGVLSHGYEIVSSEEPSNEDYAHVADKNTSILLTYCYYSDNNSCIEGI